MIWQFLSPVNFCFEIIHVSVLFLPLLGVSKCLALDQAKCFVDPDLGQCYMYLQTAKVSTSRERVIMGYKLQH